MRTVEHGTQHATWSDIMTLQDLINEAQKLINENPSMANMLVAAEVSGRLCREVILVADRPAGYDPVIVCGSSTETSPAYVMLGVTGID